LLPCSDELAEQSLLLRELLVAMNRDVNGGNGGVKLALPHGKKFHFFISHAQATGGDQANLLANNLEKRGVFVAMQVLVIWPAE
jgi:hypothetical protein